MDTSSLKTAFGKFSADFSKFAADVATYVKGNGAQGSVADVQAVVDGLNAFDAQVQAMDALVNGGAPPAGGPPPPPPVPAPAG